MNLKTLATNARSKAKGYRDGLLRYETVLTAQLFLRIFEFTSPLSKYLQTSGMDILSAHRMVTTTHEPLKKIARDFPAVKDAADCFTSALPESSLEELSKCLVVYDSRATVSNLQIELRNLAQQWDIKNRLRSCLSANKLEAFMLMAIEKDVLVSLDNDTVIDRVAEKSELMKKLLL
ncbi:4-diphosphocytidyl-2-C-methyl-D-erythritol kinase [Labeo rohita]|uniref:4-diphosphocytidyl-2-C-methyl-D-erythritol kinase n=1 Tax=Labeo rohita TaxID=84645 RepID=A0ABQ8L3F6_LABRO|nr:4-diphosphocytidyl-2-C-methyl-D-erythritol kinase [Labeo rohita]